MDSALIGLVGVLGGLLLGGTGKYFTQRRDAWLRARTSGLLLLADVDALCKANQGDRIVEDTELGTKTWESQREVLAGFRQGNYPSGFKAQEWLELASYFAQLSEIHATRQQGTDGDWWTNAQSLLTEAKRLLDCFECDPRVLPYVIRRGLSGRPGRHELGNEEPHSLDLAD